MTPMAANSIADVKRAAGKKACVCVIASMLIYLAISAGTATAAVSAAAKARLNWLAYERGMALASKEGRFVVVDFYTTWCRDCKRMDKDTFEDPEIVKAMSEGFAAVKVDCEQRPELASSYNVFAYPTVWLLAPDGKKLCQKVGYIKPAEFKLMLEYAKSGAHNTKSFQEFSKSRAMTEGK